MDFLGHLFVGIAAGFGGVFGLAMGMNAMCAIEDCTVKAKQRYANGVLRAIVGRLDEHERELTENQIVDIMCEYMVHGVD